MVRLKFNKYQLFSTGRSLGRGSETQFQVIKNLNKTT